MKQALYGFTDYPIVELGDKPREVAPIRAAKATGYDRDKYLDVEVGGVKTQIKYGYFYKKRGRCGEVPHFSHKARCQLPFCRWNP